MRHIGIIRIIRAISIFVSSCIMKYLHKITFLLLVIGGLNWLLWGAIGWEVGQLFGGMDALVSRVIYILVGLSALYAIFEHRGLCKECGSSSAGM